jgi:hypothetical protein
MRRPMMMVGWLVLAAVGLACGGSNPVEAPTKQNFARAWHLTKCTYQNQANPSETVDLVAGGWVINLFVNDNGFFLYSATPPGGSEQLTGGTWSASGQRVTFTPTGAGYSWQFTGRVREDTMTLTGADAEFDFDGSGTRPPEPATWNMAGHD